MASHGLAAEGLYKEGMTGLDIVPCLIVLGVSSSS